MNVVKTDAPNVEMRRDAMSTGPITRDDIEARFRSIQGEAEAAEDEARDYLMLGIAAVAVVIVVGAFLVGRRRGRNNRAIVEIRRI